MKNIIDLNTEIEKIVNPEIELHQEFQNIRFFENWINEVNHAYFDIWEERIKGKINDIADLESPSKVRFIKVFQQDVLQKFDDLLKVDYCNLDNLKSIPKTVYVSNKKVELPKTKLQEFYFSFEDGVFDETLTRMAKIYKIDNFDLYDAEHSSDSYKDILQDEVLNKLEEDNDEMLESIYSYVYLSFVLESTREMLGRITVYLDYLVNLIKKLENFEEDKFNIEEVFDNDPNKLKLELKLNKLEVSMLFKNLNDFGYIEVDNRGQKHPFTQLKKYIDNANMYYLNEKGEVKIIKNINKEFAKVYGSQERVMHIEREIKFLENLIAKSREKIAQIKLEEF